MNRGTLHEQLKNLEMIFLLSKTDLSDLAMKFHEEMKGEASRNNSLKMLPTYLSAPTGHETGSFLTIDFGGTNIRLQFVVLLGEGHYEIIKSCSFPLKSPSGLYDYTSKGSSAEDLFYFIAAHIAEMVEAENIYPLGHTFSFPCKQLETNRAILINWSKEFKTSGVEGHEITGLLEKALAQKDLQNVKPVAIINDTTGTLLAASYASPSADIGSICGTGHNTCYIEPEEPSTGRPMIINLESGNFNKIPSTPYDHCLDQASERPGEQILEKAVSGRYIGEIVRLVTSDLIQQKFLFIDNVPGFVDIPNSIKAEDVTDILEDNTLSLSRISDWLKFNWEIDHSSLEERCALKTIASLVTMRSAQLIAGTYIGILHHIDPLLLSEHVIAVDGALFEKMPHYANRIQTTLDEIYLDNSNKVTLRFTKDGSGIGAAIAAAICISK